jgi:ubiquinone/menaquinone biosynthesis C-methylase UbiE
MLEERASDVERIDVHFKQLRSMIRDFGSKHKMFYPRLFDGAPSVPRPELLTNCRVLNNRLEIIRGLPQGGVFAEIGTMYGDFIVRVLEINQPEEVHIFDYGMQNISAANKVKLDAYGKVKYHVGDSSSNLASLPDEYFDVIYIDADHSFHGVWKDLMQAIKKIKPSGYIVCNDYTNFDPIQVIPYGVYAAVNKFANEYNFRFEFLALSSMGFHDVALRRC